MRPLTIFIIQVIIFSTLSAQDYFPDKCAGKWEGQMVLFSKGEIVDSVNVKMDIERNADSLSWKWKTVYNSLKFNVTKDYKLILEDTESNKYTMDENNGILLYSYVFDNKMYGSFFVNDLLLNSVYSLEGDKLIFEISSGKSIGESGEGIVNYSVSNLQRSILSRVDR